MSYYEGTGEEQIVKIELIKTFVWSFAFVMFWICVLVCGLAYFSRVSITTEDVYIRRDMDKRLKKLEKYGGGEFRDHVHRYYDGKVM